MEYSSSSSGDGPSTSGRPSSRRPQYWDFVLPPPRKVLIYTSENDLHLQRLLLAVKKLHIPGARRHANKLKEKGIGLDEAVATVGLAYPKSKRHGPLHVAASTNYLEMCMILVKDYNCNPNATDADGATPLHFAMDRGGSQAVVEYLINSGADPVKANRRGITPLHCAAGKGYYEIAEYLLSIGANADPICKYGEAPLHAAAGRGHARIVRLLLEHNADIAIVFNFLEALFMSQPRNLRIPGPAWPNRPTHDLITPLVASVLGCSLECLQTLIEAGADINTDSPVTPLSVAARTGAPDCVRCLLDNNSDPNKPDEDGKLPIQIAASRGFKKCVAILLPVTTPLEKYANRNIVHMFEEEKTAFQLEARRAIEDGDAGYWEKEYAHALTCYTKALRLGRNDVDLLAKRSLCHLKNYDEDRYLDNAIYYMDRIKPDLSIPLSEEDAKKLVLEFGMKWKKPKPGSGCKPDGRN